MWLLEAIICQERAPLLPFDGDAPQSREAENEYYSIENCLPMIDIYAMAMYNTGISDSISDVVAVAVGGRRPACSLVASIQHAALCSLLWLQQARSSTWFFKTSKWRRTAADILSVVRL